MQKLPISAVIITKNEADRIAKALLSVSFCQEIIVVDSKSTDNTVSIAKSLGAKVFNQAFLGYGAQKNWGFEQASQPWILSIDADEEISIALKEEIIAKLENGAEVFSLPRLNFYLGKPLKYGREGKDRLVRLFKKGTAQYNEAIVHETIETNEKIELLKAPLYHYTYRSIGHAKEKMEHYAHLGALALKAKGKSRNFISALLSYPFYFFKHYILYGNIWNGITGFKWSVLMANYHWLKYRKLIKLNKYTFS